MRICVFGLGEAGSEIGAGLASGAQVRGFDPAAVPTPEGVQRCGDPRGAVDGADVVISVTAAVDARAALEQALTSIPSTAHYADFATGPPALKHELESIADGAGLRFTDVALMGTVPGRGIGTPAVASGADATAFSHRMMEVGMEVAVVGDTAGDAATHKLLRSVFVKGLAAVLIEAMEAAEAADLAHDTWATIVDQLATADARFLERLLEGTAYHASRRLDEMEAAASLLAELGVPATMTTATVASLRRQRQRGSDSHGRS